MSDKKRKGDVGEAAILAEIVKRGYRVALPMGEDWRYDLIVVRNGAFERVQCKYTESDGEVVCIRCQSSNNWNVIKYTPNDIDWLVTYDRTTNCCYFIPASMLGENGRKTITLRLTPPRNKQQKGILWAKDFLDW